MADLESFKQDLRSLVEKFDQDKNHYLQKGYPEAQVRIDFLNPFFEALGWDLENKAHKQPDKRDVVIEILPAHEKRVTSNLRPDYSFRIDGNTKFFVEAKAPSVALDDVNNMQSKLTSDQPRKFTKVGERCKLDEEKSESIQRL